MAPAARPFSLKVFRAKMLAGIEAADLSLPVHYPREWVVNCKSVGNGAKALIYLGRYARTWCGCNCTEAAMAVV